MNDISSWHPAADGSPSPLADAQIAVYQWALSVGSFDAARAAEDLQFGRAEVEEAADGLRRMHLLRPMLGAPDTLVAASPESAAAVLVGPLETRAALCLQAAEQTRRDLVTLQPIYHEHHRRHEGPVEFLETVDAVRRMLDSAAYHCHTELLTAHVGVVDQELVDNALPRDLEMLRRGVRMRALYPHTVRSHASTSSYLSMLSDAGAEVRTLDEVPDQLIIFDRQVLFIPERKQSETVPGAVVLREPTVVGFLHAMMEHLWDSAVPFPADAADQCGATGVVDDVKRTIVGLLGSGMKDEVAARRLGMSVRTCRRHIAEVMDELNASSRFQAGVLAVRAGLLDDPPRK